MLTQLWKYAGESRVYTFDFSQKQEILDGDTIASIDGITSSPSGLTVGSGSISGSGILSTISSGSSGVAYNLACTVTTLGGAILVCEGVLTVY